MARTQGSGRLLCKDSCCFELICGVAAIMVRKLQQHVAGLRCCCVAITGIVLQGTLQVTQVHRRNMPGHSISRGSHLADSAVDIVGLAGGLGGDLLYGALEAVVPGLHGDHFLAGQQSPQVGHDVARVVVGDVCAPASADALRAVHQHHGQNRQVPAHGPGAQVENCMSTGCRKHSALICKV